MNVTLNMLNCLREGQTALTSTQVVRRCTASSDRDVQSKAKWQARGKRGSRRTGRLRRRRGCPSLYIDVPVDGSYDDICRSNLFSTVSVNSSRYTQQNHDMDGIQPNAPIPSGTANCVGSWRSVWMFPVGRALAGVSMSSKTQE